MQIETETEADRQTDRAKGRKVRKKTHEHTNQKARGKDNSLISSWYVGTFLLVDAAILNKKTLEGYQKGKQEKLKGGGLSRVIETQGLLDFLPKNVKKGIERMTTVMFDGC